MKNWEFKLDGDKLRETIKNGTPYEVIVQLKRDIFKIINRFSKNEKYDDLVYEFEQLFYLVEGEADGGELEFIEYANSEDYGDGEIQLVDDRLSEFYDLCDSWRIFITL